MFRSRIIVTACLVSLLSLELTQPSLYAQGSEGVTAQVTGRVLRPIRVAGSDRVNRPTMLFQTKPQGSDSSHRNSESSDNQGKFNADRDIREASDTLSTLAHFAVLGEPYICYTVDVPKEIALQKHKASNAMHVQLEDPKSDQYQGRTRALDVNGIDEWSLLAKLIQRRSLSQRPFADAFDVIVGYQ